MARRLLRTIDVTITIIETWTLVWPPPEGDEPPGLEERSRCARSHSTCTASVAGLDAAGAGASTTGAGTARPDPHSEE
jgi:hypothetical protein